MVSGMPMACQTRWAAIESLYVLWSPSQTYDEFSMIKRARGATIASIMW
jgi:hypothetical protein